MKKSLKISLIVGAGLVGLAGISAGILAWTFPPSRVKAIVLEKAQERLHRTVKVDDAGLKFFPFLGVSLKGLEVANNPDSGFSKEPLLRIEELGVELSLKSIIAFSPVVSDIRIVGPKVRVEVLADGRTSIDGLGGPADTTQVVTDSVKPLELPFPLSVRKIRIMGGSIAWIDRKNGQELTIGALDQTVSLNTDKSLENVLSKGKLDVREIAIGGTGVPVRKGGMHLQVEHDLTLNLPKAAVEIRSVKASFQDAAIEMQGVASNLLGTPEIDLHVKSGKISLASLLKEIPKGLNAWVDKATLSGTVDFDMNAKGKLIKGKLPALQGSLQLDNIAAAVAGVPAKLEGLKGTIAFFPVDSLLGIKIQPMDFRLANNPVTVVLEAVGLPGHPFLKSLDARGKLDLAAVSGLVPGLDSLALAGLVDFDVKGQGPLDPANPTALELSGTATLQQVGAKITGVPDRLLINGTTTFANTELGAELAIVTGQTDLAVDATVEDWMAMVLPDLAQGKVTTITADVESNLIDLDRILPPPDTTNAKSAKPLAIPEIPDVSLSATVNVKSVKAFGMQLSALRSVTTLNSGVVAMKNSAGVYGGTFAQSLDANLSNPKSISFKTLININGVEAAELLPAIKARIPQASVRSLTKGVSGKGNISVTASGSGDPATISKQLTADIVANFSNGKLALPLFGKMTTSLHKIYAAIPDLKEINFNTFRVVGQVRDGILELQDMSLDGNEVGSVLAKGKVGLDQAIAMTADIHLPKIASGPIMAGGAAASGYLKGLGLDATIAPPADAENRVIVSYLIGGTLADPTYKADTPRLGSLAKGMAASLVSQKKKEAEALVARQRAELEARAASEKQKLQDAARAKANEATKTATDKAKNEIGKRLKGFGL